MCHLEPGLIACWITTEISPSGSGVDSSQGILVDRVLVDFDIGQVVPGKIRFEDLLWSRCLLHIHIYTHTHIHSPIYIYIYNVEQIFTTDDCKA